jgi:hypothetical protein
MFAKTVVLVALMGHVHPAAESPARPGVPGQVAPSEEKGARPAETFPDGLWHDFGIVPRGKMLKHAFRLVNTSDVPLRIVSLRRA